MGSASGSVRGCTRTVQGCWSALCPRHRVCWSCMVRFGSPAFIRSSVIPAALAPNAARSNAAFTAMRSSSCSGRVLVSGERSRCCGHNAKLVQAPRQQAGAIQCGANNRRATTERIQNTVDQALKRWLAAGLRHFLHARRPPKVLTTARSNCGALRGKCDSRGAASAEICSSGRRWLSQRALVSNRTNLQNCRGTVVVQVPDAGAQWGGDSPRSSGNNIRALQREEYQAESSSEVVAPAGSLCCRS